MNWLAWCHIIYILFVFTSTFSPERRFQVNCESWWYMCFIGHVVGLAALACEFGQFTSTVWLHPERPQGLVRDHERNWSKLRGIKTLALCGRLAMGSKIVFYLKTECLLDPWLSDNFWDGSVFLWQCLLVMIQEITQICTIDIRGVYNWLQAYNKPLEHIIGVWVHLLFTASLFQVCHFSP
jgi:hypothetical protein